MSLHAKASSMETLLFYSKYNKKIRNRIVLPNDQQYVINLNNYSYFGNDIIKSV